MQSHRLVAAAVIALLCGSSGGGCFRREREGFIAKIRFEKKRIAGRDGEREELFWLVWIKFWG